MTFVDLISSRAARVGDVLEISAEPLSPFIGVQPLRYIVSMDDVRASRMQLPDLIAYEIPQETSLLQNYPNPFNPDTWMPYQITEPGKVTIQIYDVTGRLVRRLDLGYQRAGYYHDRHKAAYWDGRNEIGESVSSGLHFYHLQTSDYSAVRRMVILK